jgi:uncharacterized membrane protein YsdA (DUF1294 family)
MPAPGPSFDYYKKMSKRYRIVYWCSIAIVFGVIGSLWAIKLLHHH